MIVFVSNFINHHQIGVAEELYTLTNGSYRFVETVPMPDSFKKTGYPDYSSLDFVVKAWENEENYQLANELCITADVVVFGGVGKVLELVKKRINTGLLTIEMGERWLKQGAKNLFSKNLQRFFWSYHLRHWSRKPFYRLCASAYSTNDLYFLHEFKGKCYKWGYFTSIENQEIVVKSKNENTCITFMWCARFLDWKHPETPILLAERLKHKGFCFVIDMFGSGEELDNIKRLIHQKNLDDFIKLRGNLPNEEILKEMRKHDIFLFTSDRNEGWGAVLNEAMANGCVPIASKEIGSVPYLIEDGQNGFVFPSCDIDVLESKALQLIENNKIMQSMSCKAVETMQLWSPKVAANRLLVLIESLKKGEESPFLEGPCSKANPI